MQIKHLAAATLLLIGMNIIAGQDNLITDNTPNANTAILLAQLDLPEIDLLSDAEKKKAGIKKEKEKQKEDLIPRTKKPVKMTIATTEDKNALGFNFQLINPAEMSITVEFSDGKKKPITMKPASATYAKDTPEKEFFKKKAEGTMAEEASAFLNHTLEFKGALQLTYFIRPNFKRYWSKYIDQNISRWDSELADAVTKNIRMEFLPDDKGCQVWMDGRYAGLVEGAKFKSITISGGSGPEITNAEPFKYTPSKYLTLDPNYSSRAGAMENGQLSIKPGIQEINGIPIIVAEAKNGIDVGLAKRMRSLELLECNEHLSRTAFDGMPESIHYSVPQAQYRRVYVLCAVEPSNEQFAEIKESAEDEEAPSAAGEMDKAAEKQKADDKVKAPEDKDKKPDDKTKEPDTKAKPKTAEKDKKSLEKPKPRTNKSPTLTARITRWGGAGRGDAIANTSIKLPQTEKDELDKRLTKVGSISYQDDGKKVTMPVYLAEFELKMGEILDLVTGEWGKKDPNAPLRNIGPYLDFEFWGPMGGVNNWSDARKIASGWASGVHVFGMTLERAPIEFELMHSQPGNVFHNDEKPETTAVLTSTAKASGKLNIRIYDVNGKTIKSTDTPVQFQGPGETQKINIPLEQPDVGWYGLDFTLLDEAGKTILSHEASFALLGKDTREAAYESPYFAWWHGGAHYTISDINILGPLYFKMGTRKFAFAGPGHSEKELEKWKLTAANIGWMGGDIKFDDPEGSKKIIIDKIADIVKRYPHCKYIHIFHESGPGGIAPEIYGNRTPKGEGYVKQATFMAELVRENFPDIKLVIGNSATTSEFIAVLLRNGFDPKYIDYMGIETPAQTGLPENLSGVANQSAWFCLETAKRFGLKLKIACSGEYVARNERNFGPIPTAQIVTRDTLLSLAYEFPQVPSSSIEPAGNAYWQTLWGEGGACKRNPLLYPLRRYVATATLTKVLDKVKLRRKVPTGVLSVYALEFDRNRSVKDIAYAIWTPRAEAELTMEFPSDAKVEVIEMFGKSRKGELKNGKITIPVGPSPIYLTSSVPVKNAQITKHITEDIVKTFRGPLTVAGKLENSNEVEMFHDYGMTPPGEFEMRTVKDDERGSAIELELKPDNKLLNISSESTVIRLKEPKPAPGKPHTIGVWVKGDSGWGTVVFEFIDAEGEVFRTAADGWPASSAINFDGWHFIGFPLTLYHESTDSRSAVRNENCYTCGGGNGKIDFPVMPTAVYVNLKRFALDPTELKPVKPVIRLRDLGTIE